MAEHSPSGPGPSGVLPVDPPSDTRPRAFAYPPLACAAVPFSLGASLPGGWSFDGTSWTATTPPVGWAGRAPAPAGAGTITAPLPAGARTVLIEPRPGAAVVGLALRDAGGRRAIPLSCASLVAGWWRIEPDAAGRPRWTEGAARLRLPPSSGDAVLEVVLAEVATGGD